MPTCPDAKLMPLRISSGWAVRFNSFFDIAPTDDVKTLDCYFDEDLLWIVQLSYDVNENRVIQQTFADSKRGYSIDVGWYPSSQANGEYIARVIAPNSNWKIVAEYKSRDRHAIAEKIEAWMQTNLANIRS